MRAVSYRATVQRLIIEWDEPSEVDCACAFEMEKGMRAYSRQVIDGCRWSRRTPNASPIGLLGVTSVLLSVEDARAVRAAFASAYAVLAEAEQRTRESTTPSPAAGNQLSVEFRALDAPELPMAEVFVVRKSLMGDLGRTFARPASLLLSSRELGLSVHTVVTMSKRIYRKLEVGTRAELGARLKAA